MKKVLTLVFLIFLCGVNCSLQSSIPFFFKDKIIAKAKEANQKRISNAKTDFKSIDLSLLKNIKNFPNIALGIDDVTIVGKNAFDGDTLLNYRQRNCFIRY
jgi:hypothetical protein